MNYNVEISLTCKGEYEIEASDKEEAIEIALEYIYESVKDNDFDIDAAAWPISESIP